MAEMQRHPTHILVLLMASASTVMFIPAIYGSLVDDHETARIFFYWGILGVLVSGLIYLAMRGNDTDLDERGQLLSLFASFTVLPLFLALPFITSVSGAGFLDVWFEMISCLTTTGASTFDQSWGLMPTVHIWRAVVGWFGGLLVWIAAFGILDPLRLVGFEMRSNEASFTNQNSDFTNVSTRIKRYALRLTPIYLGLTFLLAVGLVMVGEQPTFAFVSAMSTLSSSGISAGVGFYESQSGFFAEFLVFMFFIFAISRRSFSRAVVRNTQINLWHDPEVRMAIIVVAFAMAVLVWRHVATVASGVSHTDPGLTLTAIWGAIFTITSFLTTTGLESKFWIDTQDWAGLSTPGLLLVGVAVIGGGVATTAGGLKLLRLYALLLHGRRELELLVNPNSVGRAGGNARRIRREGGYISWVIFMLFALSVAVCLILLTLCGVQFEDAIVLAIAAISTTGPLAEIGGETPILMSGMTDSAKMVIMGAMVVGRLETLALVALFNPDLWRN